MPAKNKSAKSAKQQADSTGKSATSSKQSTEGAHGASKDSAKIRGNKPETNVPRTAATGVTNVEVAASGDFDMRAIPPRTDVAHTTNLAGGAGKPLSADEVDAGDPESNPLSQHGPVSDTRMGAFASPQGRAQTLRTQKAQGHNVSAEEKAEEKRLDAEAARKNGEVVKD